MAGGGGGEDSSEFFKEPSVGKGNSTKREVLARVPAPAPKEET